jgi:hypothetical protein
MLSGAQLLQSFDERLARAEREAAAAQAEADRLAGRRDALRAAETEALRDLARLRVVALREPGGTALERLDTAGARARALLEEQARAIAGADATLAERRHALQAATDARDGEAARLREAEAKAEAALATARERMEEDPAWCRLRATAEEAARIAQHAGQKAEFARRDLEAKGKPYMDDPLFAYLWRRGYGTAAYRAGPVARLLDRFTARVARYEPARRDYALLTELPERLSAHAARMDEEAAKAASALAEHERRVAGLPPAEGLAALRDALDRADDAVEAAHSALDEAERARAALVSGEDEATRDAAAALESALAQESLRDLRDAAARTPTPQDDAVVARLEQAGAERVLVERELAQSRAEAETARRRVQELLSVRQEMRGRGYSRDRWNLRDGALIGLLLSELLRGGLSRDGFWDRLGRHRIPGGGPWGGGPWGAPGTGGRDSGGFGGDGGFRTGGTIGGGGFKTGGSF